MNSSQLTVKRYVKTLVRPAVAATAAIAMSLALASGAAADGDAAKGEKVFIKCKTCHEASAETNKIGPYLKGIFGRKAGTAKGYSYSPAMKSSGIVWDDDKLEAFVTDPKALVPGTKMTFVGIKKEEEVENLLAYLKEATK